jgi:predicted helicase
MDMDTKCISDNLNVFSGYIYVRSNELCDIHDCYKLGRTQNILERENNYITSEIYRGHFKNIYEIYNYDIEKCERILFRDLKDFNIYKGAGKEYYKKCSIENIEKIFNKKCIKYKILSVNEINNLTRIKREKNNSDDSDEKIELCDLYGCEVLSENIEEEYYEDIETKYIKIDYKPREYQKVIISKALSHLTLNNKGILALTCGIGKTLISLWITKELNAKTIVIGVPNILLLKQWKSTINSLFNNIPILIVSKNIELRDIIEFLNKNSNDFIIITTYASSYKVKNAFKDTSIIPFIKILDEMHHLTSHNINEDKRRSYVNILKIQSHKQLSLTATLKILENKGNYSDNDIIISNDNIKYFGDIIDKKCLLWAINENIICDYVIQTIITVVDKLEYHLNKFNIINDNDKRLFLSAFSSLKSIFENHSHHLLIYSNNMNNSMKIIEYIKLLIEDKYFIIPDLYYSSYHSNNNSEEQRIVINKFENAKCGIISCVYCLGEGWDFPLLDAVVFAENMSSNIRILQSAQRASRKNVNQPNKITKIILPILNKDDLIENNNPDLKKVREVIYQMGLEDETITQKIKVFNIVIKKERNKYKPLLKNVFIESFGDYDNDFTQKLRLKTIKRVALSITYDKARKIIIDKNIKTKDDYYKLCEIDNRLSTEPEIDFKGRFTNWIEYLSIERVFYDLETCKNKVEEYLMHNPEIKKHYLDLSYICEELCKLDKLFPPSGLWVEYYNLNNLNNIIVITIKKKSKGTAI